MREILFRGKRISNGEWVEGGVMRAFHPNFDSTAQGFAIQEPNCYCICANYKDIFVEQNTIGQYTGLQDKNGKRIFEGDIFKFPDEVFESFETSCGTEYNSFDTENYGVVGFCEFTGRFDFVQYRFNQGSVDADLHENHTMEFHDFVCELEVIGNIHDNPELLEVNHED